MKEKSDVKFVLEEMLANAQNQGHAVQQLLSDNGGEFDDVDIRDILHKNGVTQRLTAPLGAPKTGANKR